jgi:hypothetical protein
MASTNSWQTTSRSEITINLWSPELGLFDNSIQTIAFPNCGAIDLVESHKDLAAFLFASEKKTSLYYNPLVRIFKYNHKQVVPFVEVQQIKDSEVLSIGSTLSDDRKLLVFMLTIDRINLYQLKGSSGFVKVYQISAQNAINFITLHNDQQYITGEKVFVGDLWVNNLNVNYLNGISMNDIVLLKTINSISPQILTYFQTTHPLDS